MTNLPDTPFWNAYQGRFSGLLQWKDVDALWQDLPETGGKWYVFDTSENVPAEPANPAAFQATLHAAELLVNSRRDRSHSGAIYIDNRENPQLVKIFDPVNMGTSCSCSTEPIYPRYILSRIKPDPIPTPAPPPQKGFLARLRG